VSFSYSLDPQLGTWASKQCVAFKKGRMGFEQKAELNEIGFEFSAKNKANEKKWNLQFKKLQDYYGKHGHCELFCGLSTILPSTLTIMHTNTPPSTLPTLQVN
jgi:hypothetical protein